ncbi:MAG: undecaprenyl-phosphate glucose phosphotransferase [Steroidobacterales bacterium]
MRICEGSRSDGIAELAIAMKPGPSSAATISGHAEPRIARGLSRDFVALAHDLLALGDVCAIGLSGTLSALLWMQLSITRVLPGHFWATFGSRVTVAAVIAPFVLRASRPENVREQGGDRRWNAHELSWRFVVFVLLMLVIGYATGSLHKAPDDWLALWAVLGWSAVMSNRWLLIRSLEFLERRGSLRDVVAIVGAGELADRVVQHFKHVKSSGLQIAGVFDDRLTRHQAVANRPCGTVQDLLEVGKTRRIDWILIAIPAAAEQRLGSLAHQLKALATSIAICPQQFALNVPHHGWAYVGDSLPAALLVDRPLRGWGAVVKRLEDIALASILLLLSLPLLALIALAVWVDSPGPIIFRQRRHGWNNRAFDVLKFRTMRWTPATTSALMQTSRNDQRISRVGRFLRRTSLDELPQLLNVLQGDMSLVGPRPHAIDMRTEDRLGHEIVGEYPHRHRVKPGITGWAQVNGYRGATQTADQIRRRVELDLYYADNWSVLLDLKILLKTLGCIIGGKNAF